MAREIHLKTSLKRHDKIPYLWRVTCHCGWYALAASQGKAEMAIDDHVYREEPFPDLTLEPEPK